MLFSKMLKSMKNFVGTYTSVVKIELSLCIPLTITIWLSCGFIDSIFTTDIYEYAINTPV